MEKLNKKQAEEKINEFFLNDKFSPEDLKKIKALAMKYKIRLGKLKNKFCSKCYFPLKGKIRNTKEWKIIICSNCKNLNRFRIS